MEKHELDRSAVGFWQLAYQSISLVSPAGAMAATMTGAAVYAQGALPLTYIIGFIAAAFSINTTVQFSRKLASAGGFYAYASHGVGPRYGILTGWLFILSYFTVVTNGSLFAGAVFIPGLIQLLFHIVMPQWIGYLITLGFIGFTYYFAWAGIKPSLKYSLSTGTLEIIYLLVIGIGLIIVAGSHNTGTVFITPHLAKNGWSGVGIGMILALFSMSGSSGAVALGEETQSPQRTITRAVLTSFAFVGVLFVLLAYAQTVSWGPDKMTSFANASVPGVELVMDHFGIIWAVILALFVINSFLAGALAPANSAVRMLYAYARDGVIFPSSFSRIHQRNRSPYVAVHWMMLVATLVTIVFAAIFGPFNGFLVMVTISSVALYVGHLLANLAVTMYYLRLREFRLIWHGIIPSLASILVLFGIYFTLVPMVYPVILAPIVTLVWLILGWIFIVRQSPDQIAKAGKFTV
ncbi:APC family permease [Alicyclobacillus tolerans]|uniref:APC family permease n=1 Tax=Alicyclobacillus tolerans TaxID=90970 RepID=UPI003B7E6604